jgi:two-component system response regulator NreC
MAASIVVADDHLVLREGIRAVFDAEPDINVVAEAADGLEALNLVNELDPDLLLIDLSMPGLPGLEVIRRVTTGAHETKVIVLTMHADEEYASKALSNGASAYVTKTAGIESLKKAIRTALDGGLYVSAPLREDVIEDYVGRIQDRKPDPYEALTNREREVLHLVSDGLTNEDISTRLDISRRTVEAHRSRLMLKLRMKSQADLIRYAINRETAPPER